MVSSSSHVSLEPAAPVAGVTESSARTEWRVVLILLLWFVVVAITIGVHRDIPVIDDWTYAWSVERLLDDGRLEVLDWSAVYPLAHSLWGAAWSLVLGFSFVTLRLSTLAFALLASCALYLILRELEASPRIALLGALTVAANPVVLLLSSSFMTDVPFVGCTLMALLCYIRAMRRGQVRLVWWAGAWAFAACLDRQIGLLTPLAALPLLVPRPQGEPMKRSAVLVAIGVTWGAMLVCSLAIMSIVKPTGEMIKLVDRLVWVVQIPVTRYLIYNLYALSGIAFFALPALLAMATARGLWRRPTLFVVILALGAVMLGLMGEIPVPLRPGSTWSLVEVGGSRGLINGLPPGSEATTIEVVLRGAGLLAFALALISLGRPDRPGPLTFRMAHWSRPVLRRVLDAVKAIPVTTRTPLVIYLIAYLVLANVLWMYNDRYLIVLLPVIVALALGVRQPGLEVPRLAWFATAIFAIVAVVGTRDALRFNESVRDSWQALVDSGVRPSDIDAGYAWTGWILYAHPENLAKGLTVRDVPWITSKRRPTYILSKSPLDGYDIAREVTWTDDAPWPGPDRLLVLKRRAPNQPRGAAP
jgi:hypothetical protein